MGCLLGGGYLNDFKTLYCPSGAGMEQPTIYLDGSGWHKELPLGNGLQDLIDVSKYCKAGGKELFYADYSSAPADYHTIGGSQSIRSQYNYRPNIAVNDADHSLDTIVWLPGTKPAVEVRMGRPYFRTQKILGERALLCDSFEKSQHATADIGASELTETARVAAGNQAHRDGYNVLYGDGHAAWYGDPQKRIIWFKTSAAAATSRNYARMDGPSLRYRWNEKQYGDENYLDGSHLIWHNMDIANGVDADATW